MASAKRVTRYEASDGEMFDNRKDADTHEKILELSSWYDGNTIENVNYDWVVIWLQENKKQVLDILGETKRTRAVKK